MAIMNISSPSQRIPENTFSLFALGFRPFFLAAGAAAVVLLLAWMYILSSATPLQTYYGVAGWHSHEMLFGFVSAVIAGFLLTATRNWTSVQTLSGAKLGALVVLWLAARVVALFPHVIPGWLIAGIDLIFVPLLALSLALPIIKADKKPQLIFVAILMTMFVANLLVHLHVLGVMQDVFDVGIRLALNSVLLIIVIMAGRVLPFFTERGAPGAEPKKWRWIEYGAIASMLTLLVMDLFFPDSQLRTVVLALLFIFHAIRLWGWYSMLVWRVPLLWVLHLGYLWLVIGFAFEAVASFSSQYEVLAMHCYAAAIGVLCLGMMARVSLGHTGRKLQAAKVMAWAFGMINIAMLIRVFAPLLLIEWSTPAVVISGILWAGAFLIFLFVYVPILFYARVDGQPG